MNLEELASRAIDQISEAVDEDTVDDLQWRLREAETELVLGMCATIAVDFDVPFPREMVDALDPNFTPSDIIVSLKQRYTD